MSKSFGAASTTDEVLDGVKLNGKRVLVTGVSAGLGVETARALAAHGAEVVGAARDLAKAKAATAAGARRRRERRQPRAGGARSGLACKRARLRRRARRRAASRSISSFATRASWRRRSARRRTGSRRSSGPTISAISCWSTGSRSLMKPGARLVNLSSAGHQISDVDLDDPNFERTPYSAWSSYGRSKTANILFAVEFDRRHKDRGIRATAPIPAPSRPSNRIASLMKRGSRLVNLSSAGHRYSDVDLDDPNFERTTYDPWVAYGRSKTANILFAVEFDRRHKAERNSRDRRPSRRHPDRALPSYRRGGNQAS